MSQSFPLCWVMDTVTESPALMESGTSRDDWGSISIHDVYTTPLPSTIAWVPAWMRSRLESPPIPTHVASAPLEFSETVGTVHVAVTEVNVPPLAAYPDQLLELLVTEAGVPGCVTVGEVPVLGLMICVVGWTSAEIFHVPD